MTSEPATGPAMAPPRLPPISEYFAPRVGQSYAAELWSFSRARQILRAVGPWKFLKRLLEHPSLPWIRFIGKPLTAFGRRISGRTTFGFGESRFPYPPWYEHGERRVEIPVALDFLAAHRADGVHVLEIGNVLHRYTDDRRTGVDKYEKGPGILNSDVVDFDPPASFDVVLAISTLEHVGFDEDRQDLGKFRRAVEHLYERCLRPGGWMLITVPLGYHPEVDRVVLGGHLGLGEVRVLLHASWLGEWKEEPLEKVARNGPPMYPYHRHRSAAVAIWSLHRPELAALHVPAR